MLNIYHEAIRILNQVLYAKNRGDFVSLEECNEKFRKLLEKWRLALTGQHQSEYNTDSSQGEDHSWH